MNRPLFVYLSLLLATSPLPALDMMPELRRHVYNASWYARDVAAAGKKAFVLEAIRDEFGEPVAPGSLQVFDISNPADLQRVGSHDFTDGSASGMVVSDNYVYTASGDAGLQVVDISDPTRPKQIGQYDTHNRAVAVALSDQYAYLAVGDAGLLVIDTSEPFNPQAVGRVNLGDYVGNVAINGNYAYVAARETGLHIIDTVDPAQLQVVGGLDLKSNVRDVAIAGNFVFVTNSDSRLLIIDISDPSTPTQISNLDVQVYSTDLEVAGNYAYVVGRNVGLQLIDITDPANPVRVGGYDGDPREVAVSGNYAYVTEGYPSSLAALDVTDPANPQRVGGYAVAVDPMDMVVTGNYACVIDSQAGLIIYELSDSAPPNQIAGYSIGSWTASLGLYNNHVLVTADNTLHVIDITNPAAPSGVGDYVGDGTVVGMAVAGHYAYLAEHPRWDGVNYIGGGLQLIDLGDLAHPQRIGSYGDEVGMYANSVAISGDYALLADGGNFETGVQGEGLIILNISNPTNPTRIGGYPTAGAIQGVAVSGNHAYLTVRSRYNGGEDVGGGLEVLDISDPANPFPLGAYEVEGMGYSEDILISGNYAFAIRLIWLGAGQGSIIANGPLDIIDISNLSQPRYVGRYSGSGIPSAITSSVRALSKQHQSVWIAESAMESILHGHLHHGGGLQEFVVGPANPQRIGSFASSSSASGWALQGGFAYAREGLRRLQIIDLTDPTNPLQVSSMDTGRILHAVAVDRNYAYAAGKNGMDIINVRNPAQPKRVGGYEAEQTGTAVTVTGNYAYLCIEHEGLFVIDIVDRANPQFVGSVHVGGRIRDVSLAGDYAYLANGNYGLQVIDVSDPANPWQISTIDVGGYANEVSVTENYVYVAALGAGPVVIDITDPFDPQRIGVYESIGFHGTVTGHGTLAYVVSPEAGLLVIDFSNPGHPMRVGNNPNISIDDSSSPVNDKVFVVDEKVYVADDQGVNILYSYQPLHIDRPVPDDRGGLQLRIAGPPDVPGRLQRSADLTTWKDWFPVTFGEDPLEISDPDAGVAAAGFYRLVVP